MAVSVLIIDCEVHNILVERKVRVDVVSGSSGIVSDVIVNVAFLEKTSTSAIGKGRQFARLNSG